MTERISRRQLEELSPTLSERDFKILAILRQCRHLTTKQIQRLYFESATTALAGLKAANRNMNKLKGLELTNNLARRVGGINAGSGSRIWHLTETGERLLRLGDGTARPRRRPHEPSSIFLKHTLAVAECFIQLTEICGGKGLELIKAEMEPDCWRSYSHKGHLTALRPDMFTVTVCGEYEDRWFVEIDLNTEAPVTVVEKCRRYYDYYRSGLEQKEHEVFPLTVWIVPDEARKESLTAHIREAFPKMPRIFIVITPDELENLIRQGVEGAALC
ncbi:MAG: replication-relaxation family protein [Candidatus Saccharimonadales bacterium]